LRLRLRLRLRPPQNSPCHPSTAPDELGTNDTCSMMRIVRRCALFQSL
jgi:hypothetical protein